MKPYYDQNGITIYHGDSAEILPSLSGLDACVTDPPYGLSFMGKAWDYDVPTAALWAACLAALKPGAHLLAFAGTRTQHRMAVNIEDAGFEIRDMIAWVYGQGFPKSLDVSKAIDSAGGASPAEQARVLKAKRTSAGMTREVLADAVGCTTSSVRDWEEGRARAVGATVEHIIPSRAYRSRLADILGYTKDERKIAGVSVDRRGDGTVYGVGHAGVLREGGNTDAAKQWQGWGTALKPALEPITMARKPLIGTVAQNVLEHGTGGVNVDGCRVATNDLKGKVYNNSNTGWKCTSQPSTIHGNEVGRFPANLIHDGSEEVTATFPDAPGQQGDLKETGRPRPSSGRFGDMAPPHAHAARAESNKNAARFFYCAKASKSDRNSGLDGTRTVEYRIDTGGTTWKGAATELVTLLRRATSESTVTWHTGECGESIVGVCRLDSLSTTLTAISRITTSQILNSLTPSLINGFTQGAGCATANGGSRAANAENSSECRQTSTPESPVGSARGASLAVSEMLSAISEGANWKQYRNTHSTVKPVDLMRYLVRLVCRPGGTVLDPFMGSGTTLLAAQMEGMRAIGIEREEKYCEIAVRRLAQQTLFVEGGL